MDTMNPKFRFLSTKYSLPDVECWAIEKLGVSENGLDTMYSNFAENLKGVACNVFSLAEYINDFFEIERHVKRQRGEYGADVMDVLLVNHDGDGTMIVALQPRYLNMIDENLLPSHLLHPNRADRLVSVQYGSSGD